MTCTRDQYVVRDASGVKQRNTAVRNDWAEAHRLLDRSLCMVDLDESVFRSGGIDHHEKSEDQLYVEFKMSYYGIKYQALFDCKDNRRGANYSLTHRPASFKAHCHIARKLAARFFLVIGKTAPWTMIEVDVTNGKPISEMVVSTKEDFNKSWIQLGLL